MLNAEKQTPKASQSSSSHLHDAVAHVSGLPAQSQFSSSCGYEMVSHKSGLPVLDTWQCNAFSRVVHVHCIGACVTWHLPYGRIAVTRSAYPIPGRACDDKTCSVDSSIGLLKDGLELITASGLTAMPTIVLYHLSGSVHTTQILVKLLEASYAA